MTAYMGTDHAITLQKNLEARAAEISANPVLSNGGRILNILDPDAFGWQAVRHEACQFGFVGLTMVDKTKTLSRAAEVFGDTADLPYWEAFTGTPDKVRPACEEILSGTTLPDGWRTISATHPDEDTIRAAQILNSETGVAPQPAYYLRGHHLPSMLAGLRDSNGTLVACASATMRYHPDSALGGWLFAGSVSVHPDHRRKGLGVYVNAVLLCESLKTLGWTGVLEQAKADNTASVGMIRRCGLTCDPTRVTIVVNTTGSQVTR